MRRIRNHRRAEETASSGRDRREPGLVRVAAAHVQAGPTWSTTLAVTGYPPEVGMAWLQPLTSWPGVLDVAVHVEPIPAQAAAARIRRRRIRMESGRRSRADRGSLDDPLVEAVSQDAGDLADKVARGESRLFFTTVLLTVHATTGQDLQEQIAGIRAHAASMLLETEVLTWRQWQGWLSTLPIGADRTGMRRIMDTEALATACPIAGPDLPAALPGEDFSFAPAWGSPPPNQATGSETDLEEPWPDETPGDWPDNAPGFDGSVLMGMNLVSGGVVTSDRWRLDNHNQVVLARSGAGKSYAIKVAVLREMYNGVRVSVIDPEREYLELARQVGGRVIEIGAPGVSLNPFILAAGDPDAFTRRCLFLHTLVDVMLTGPLDARHSAALDRAVIATYAAAGITRDPSTWSRPAPSLDLLVRVLEEPDAQAGAGEAGTELAARLIPWVDGSFAGLFGHQDPPASQEELYEQTDSGPPVEPDGQLTVWTTRLLPEELRPVGMLLATDAIWRAIDRRTPDAYAETEPDGPDAPDRPERARWPVRQLVVVDEASMLLSEPAGARFLARLAKTSRKRKAGLLLITPDVVDLLSSDLGEVVLANAATVLLLRQAPQAIQTLTRACALSPGEAQFLTTARRGQGLLLAAARIPIDIVASPREDAIGSADPEDLHSPPGRPAADG